SLAAASLDGMVQVWDVVRGRKRLAIRAHAGNARSVAFSPDGRILATGGSDAVKLWDPATGEEKCMLTGQAQMTVDLVFSPNGKTLASGSWDKTVKLWELTGDK